MTLCDIWSSRFDAYDSEIEIEEPYKTKDEIIEELNQLGYRDKSISTLKKTTKVELEGLLAAAIVSLSANKSRKSHSQGMSGASGRGI